MAEKGCSDKSGYSKNGNVCLMLPTGSFQSTLQASAKLFECFVYQ